MSTIVSAVKRPSAQGYGLVWEVREGSPEEVKLDLPSGRLGEWKEGQCCSNAENMVVKPWRFLRTSGAVS